MLVRKAILVGTVAVAALAAAGQDGVVLKRSIAEGSVEKYSVVTATKQQMSLPGMGDQEITTDTTGNYELKFGAFDAAKKAAVLEVIFTLTKMKMDGPQMMGSPDEYLNKPMSTKGTIDERGRIVMPPAKDTNALMSSLQGLTSTAIGVEFPENPVKFGDTWTMVVPKDGIMRQEDQKLTAKLIGEKEVDGVTGYEITVEGDLTMEADLAKLMGENMPVPGQMLLKGKVHLLNNAVVDKATGKILLLKSTGKTDQKIDLPDAGLSINATGTTQSEMKLQK